MGSSWTPAADLMEICKTAPPGLHVPWISGTAQAGSCTKALSQHKAANQEDRSSHMATYHFDLVQRVDI